MTRMGVAAIASLALCVSLTFAGLVAQITTALLNAYLAERVKELTRGEQHPVMSRPEAVPDFPVALVR
jgi:hypothetical protein